MGNTPQLASLDHIHLKFITELVLDVWGRKYNKFMIELIWRWLAWAPSWPAHEKTSMILYELRKHLLSNQKNAVANLTIGNRMNHMVKYRGRAGRPRSFGA